jgi:hypothetical protein
LPGDIGKNRQCPLIALCGHYADMMTRSYLLRYVISDINFFLGGAHARVLFF